MMLDPVGDAFLIERTRRFRDGAKRFSNLPGLVGPTAARAPGFDSSDARLAAYRDDLTAEPFSRFRGAAVSIPGSSAAVNAVPATAGMAVASDADALVRQGLLPLDPTAYWPSPSSESFDTALERYRDYIPASNVTRERFPTLQLHADRFGRHRATRPDDPTLTKVADVEAFNPPKSEQQIAVEEFLRSQGVDPTAWWQATPADDHVRGAFDDPGVRSTGLLFYFLGPDGNAYFKDVPPDPWTAAIHDTRQRARLQAMQDGRNPPSIWDVLPHLLTSGKLPAVTGGKSLAIAGGKPLVIALNLWGMHGSPRTQALNQALVTSFQQRFPQAVRVQG
jgi:hypothetical protein